MHVVHAVAVPLLCKQVPGEPQAGLICSSMQQQQHHDLHVPCTAASTPPLGKHSWVVMHGSSAACTECCVFRMPGAGEQRAAVLQGVHRGELQQAAAAVRSRVAALPAYHHMF